MNGNRETDSAQVTDRRTSAQRRTTLAEDRTDWARERTMQAKQRTYTAWVRTGLAALAAGIAAAKLLNELRPLWLSFALGAALIAVSAVIFVMGYMNYRKTFRKLQEAGMVSYRLWVVGLITLVLVLASLAGMVLLLLN